MTDDELRYRLKRRLWEFKMFVTDQSPDSFVDHFLPLVRAEIVAAERRGAERAAQAIEAEPRFRDSMTGAALWVGNIAAKRAREAVPAPTGDNA